MDEERDRTIPQVRIGGQNQDVSNTPLIDDGIGHIIRGEASHTETGYVIFLDALGMKRVWEHYHYNQVNMMWKRSIQSFMDSIERFRSYLNVEPRFRVLSDTIIITIPVTVTPSSISWVFDLLCKPFMDSIMNHMLFRGIISYGQYSISTRLLLGPALAESASQNDKLNWIGVALTPQLAEKAACLMGSSGLSTANAIWYCNVPHKDMQVYRSVVLNWPQYDTDETCFNILNSEYEISRDKLKYENTFAFYAEVG